jgi:prolyl-tRNA editing enzyme YbaK/EbsC (Cys-tRNA(Pro) deacylase)
VSSKTGQVQRFAVICASDRLDMHKAADAFGVSRHELRFASEADMATEFPAYEVGAVPPIGPDTPVELIDPRLLDYGQVLCPAGDHVHSLLIDPRRHRSGHWGAGGRPAPGPAQPPIAHRSAQ